MERILLALGDDDSSGNSTQVYIIGLGDEARPSVAKLAEDLRQNNIRTNFDPLRRSIKAQMREANKSGATIAVIIGDKELASGQAKIKDLKTGDQEPVKIKALVDHINSLTL
jgi:histidyl-tRNA synthetase